MERVRAHRASIDDLLGGQRAERAKWLKLGAGAFVVALLGGGWLLVQVSVTRELSADTRRCDAGDRVACSKVALAHFNGSAVKQDRAKSFQYFERACALGHAESCSDQASALRFGWGVAKDLAGARAKYEQACKLGHQKACAELEALD